MSTTPDIRIALDPRSTREQLLRLAQSDPEYAVMVARHPKADAEILDDIYAMCKDTDYQDSADAAVLVNGLASKELVRKVAKKVAAELAVDDDCDYPQERQVAVPLACHVHTPKVIVRELAKSWFHLVREQIAARADLPRDLLADLSQDCNPHVRKIVANNPRMTAGLLVPMTDDPDETVRFAVARNGAANKMILKKLADDESEAVRLAVGCSAEFERRNGRVKSLAKDISAIAGTVAK